MNKFAANAWCCSYPECNNVAMELAHRIANTEDNISIIKDMANSEYDIDLTKAEAKELLWHELNVTPSCRKHNPTFNIGNQPEKARTLMRSIVEDFLVMRKKLPSKS